MIREKAQSDPIGEEETYLKYLPLVQQKNSPIQWPSSWPWEYIPHVPTGKQLLFLQLPHKEAFYGGAAGGGKSDALLMAALQYVETPDYSAILFRKTFSDLKLGGALIDRSMQWLLGTRARWDGSQHVWHFPSGAQIAFGYLDSEMDFYRYQGAEFQYIGFDELTQHQEENYLYLFSRLRRLEGSDIPLRMRGASNPGGLGHQWVQKRYAIKQVGNIYRGTNPKRPHIPAFLSDNPYLEQESYRESLQELDPITREQLLRGDWGVAADARFRKKWMRYYTWQGDYLVLAGKACHRNRCRCFQTVDPAASTRAGPGDEQIWRRQASSTCISTWLLTPDWHLVWIDCKLFQVEIPDVLHAITKAYQQFRPEYIAIEPDGLGIGVYQYAARSGLPVRSLKHRSVDKLVQATDACNRMEQGKIWLPEENTPWKEEVEAQLFTWTGHPQQAADIVDTLADAALLVSYEAGSSEHAIQYSDMPSAW